MESAVFSPLVSGGEHVEDAKVEGEGGGEREGEGVVSSSDTGKRYTRRNKKKSVYKHVPHRSGQKGNQGQS